MAETKAYSGDVAENALDPTTDFSYVRVLDNNQNSSRINKDDLVKVLEGRMGNPIGAKPIFIRGNDDFNTITESGTYILSEAGSAAHGPNFRYGILLVFANGDSVLQIVVDSSSARVAIRYGGKTSLPSVWKIYNAAA